MRLLPDPWLGQSDVFPSIEEPFPANELVHAIPMLATVLGTACGGLARVVAPRRFPHAVGYGITTWTLLLATTLGEKMAAKSRRVRQLPIVERENIKIPYRKLWEPTESWSPDDGGMIGSLVGAGVAARTKPLGMSLSKLFATRLVPGITIGFAVGFGTVLGEKFDTLGPKTQLQRQKWNRAREIYRQKTQQQEPDWLYPKHVFSARLDGVEFANNPRNKDEPQPGEFATNRFVATYNGNDNTVVSHVRDYDWSPSIGESLRVEANIQLILKHRLSLAQETEYLWYEIGNRERDLLATPLSEGDKQELELVLLNDIHLEWWTYIAILDRVVVESRKIIQQLQSGDKWAPSRPTLIEPQTFKPEYLVKELARQEAEIERELSQDPSLSEHGAMKLEAIRGLVAHYEDKRRGPSK